VSPDRKDAMITKHTDLIIDEEFCGELIWRRHSCQTERNVFEIIERMQEDNFLE
jgi:hypothetical protein